jgi:hypothetical protein
MKTRFASMLLGGLLAVSALAAMGRPAFALDPYSSPIISCGTAGLSQIEIKICGGTTGAPAGITIQYKKVSDWQVSGWADDGTLCKLSLSGQPSLQHPDKSRWELNPNECETVLIGDVNFDETGVSGNECSVTALDCGTDYVFRAFAHAGRRMARSEWSEDLFCSTIPCESGCTLTQGFWKTHGPSGCDTGNNANAWPVSSLTVGNVTYTASQLCAIFNTPAGGNGLISLAHQLIAAKFNVLSGASASCVNGEIAAADALIGNLVIPPVGAGYLSPSSSSALATTLDNYNTGSLCVDHCTTPNAALRNGALPIKKSTWGNMKTIYR